MGGNLAGQGHGSVSSTHTLPSEGAEVLLSSCLQRADSAAGATATPAIPPSLPPFPPCFLFSLFVLFSGVS